MKRRHKVKRPKRRYLSKNPGIPVLNKQGGVFPTTTFELIKARAADLGTLPKSMAGTNCGNCLHFRKGQTKIGYCAHKLISQSVTVRQCCIFWRARGWLISTKAVSK